MAPSLVSVHRIVPRCLPRTPQNDTVVRGRSDGSLPTVAEHPGMRRDNRLAIAG